MWKRWSSGLVVSLVAHVAAAIVALFAAGGRLASPVEIEVTGLRLEDVKDLPLGGPAHGPGKPKSAATAATDGPSVPPDSSGRVVTRPDDQRPKPRPPKPHPATVAPRDEEGGPAPTSNLRAYGPRGSRLTVLMRLDRLRGTEYAPVLDGLLMYLPDRRDLLEPTGVDLFNDFDAVLVATPNPLDPAVTFLAARHHLEDSALRAALARGTRTTGRTLSWRTEAGRPVGEWRRRAPGAAVAARDDRLIVLAAPGLAVVTPPAYRRLLLGATAKGDGAKPLSEGEARDAGVPEGGNGGASALGWTGLLSRIDAEEGLMPEDGAVMINAVDIFRSPAARASARASVFGLDVPAAVNAVVGIGDGAPFLDVAAELATEASARQWEAQWPDIQRRLRANPYLILTGFSALVGRTSVTREASTVRLHLTLTREETMRLLAFARTLLSARFGDPPRPSRSVAPPP